MQIRVGACAITESWGLSSWHGDGAQLVALLPPSQHTRAHGHWTWVEAARGTCGQGWRTPCPLVKGFLPFQEIACVIHKVLLFKKETQNLPE